MEKYNIEYFMRIHQEKTIEYYRREDIPIMEAKNAVARNTVFMMLHPIENKYLSKFIIVSRR